MKHKKSYYAGLTAFVLSWLTFPAFAADSVRGGGDNVVATKDVVVEANQAKEEAKYESQQTTIITAEDIEKKQAKSVEDIIFSETGMSRNVDAMGRVTVSIRGAEPRHTLILVDGQPVMGDFAKYSGQADELQRLGTENVERIEIIQGAASAKYGSDAIGGVINVVTKKAAKDAGLQVNVEGRRAKSDGDIFPYQNFFLRADSGQMGKLRLAAYGSKRDIMPIYTDNYTHVDMSEFIPSDVDLSRQGFRNSLRYYGSVSNIGLSGVYEINDRNTLEFSADHYTEDMERVLKHSDSPFEPVQDFKRDMERDNYDLSWRGNNGGRTDWKVEMKYARMNEDDVTLTRNYYNSPYEGKNTLSYIDDIDHREYDFRASANTQVNDNHLLTYGFGYTYEKGEGSRLKNAPDRYRYHVDPWDYDKSLQVDTDGVPSSAIHDYAMSLDEDGVPYWNMEREYYNYDSSDSQSVMPAMTYEEYQEYKSQSAARGSYEKVDQRLQDLFHAFQEQLSAIPENQSKPSYYLTVEYGQKEQAPYYYYGGKLVLNGKTFQQEYDERENWQSGGRASIRKQNFYIGDTWQVNDTTILSPIVRLDHSDLFGSEVTFNLGLTHNLGGHANRRFKANIGTGYTEPGMGELYYNWEMYGSSPVSYGTARMGWYWVGNPDLKPEKSVNVDIGLEAENERTTVRAGLFYNRIRDYMTTYYTGKLMDFYPGLTESTSDGALKWLSAPDMIYSFKNIGRAEITGFEASVEQKFGSHWKGKLGYTWLHAINKSDPSMPRQLLDKPQHKVDIGISYENKESGWSGSLWGDYYINMLDSNAVANGGNYFSSYEDPSDSSKSVFVYTKGNPEYQKKTFGIWNVIVQKQLDKDTLVYAGVDNIFNHRDDDRALQERVYKFGVNMKFGAGADSPEKQAVKKVTADAARAVGVDAANSDWFIKAPFDTTKKQGVEVIGDYRARWNVHGGANKPQINMTATSSVGTAEKNMFDNKDHGFEQRLRLGVDARIGENTNVTVLGSASGMSGVDTMHDVSDSKGLNHQRVENIDVTQHASKWDFSVGRLTEPMGVTGYWFGKEYDGGRAVWTSGKDQVRLGYGDFSHSTGIDDSPYNHVVVGTFYRPPTVSEFVGIRYEKNKYGYNHAVSEEIIEDSNANINFFQQIKEAKTADEQLAIVKRMYELAQEAYGDYIHNEWSGGKLFGISGSYSYYTARGRLVKTTSDLTGDLVPAFTDARFLEESGMEAYWEENKDAIIEQIENTAKNRCESKGYQFVGWNLNGYDSLSDYVYASMKRKYDMSTTTFIQPYAGAPLVYTSQIVRSYFNAIASNLITWTEDGSLMPRSALGDVTGVQIKTTGTVLQRDTIPSIDRAAFVQYKHQMGDHFGIQAWYLRSVNDDTHSIAYANGDANDVSSFDQLANIIGIGAKWKLGSNAFVSFDWGQNRTDFGRFMNGATVYEHDSSTLNSDFAIKGRERGGTPRFWVARVDVGHADMDKPGSWNAFADYKYFQHGSFFGGNGTEALPDRYLDGIKSFTIGGGYVPAKDFLIEAFYTFDAKGIGKRDTLYGSENFTLGDYTRIQATFRF